MDHYCSAKRVNNTPHALALTAITAFLSDSGPSAGQIGHVVVVVVVVVALIATMQSVVTGQAPITLEWNMVQYCYTPVRQRATSIRRLQ